MQHAAHSGPGQLQITVVKRRLSKILTKWAGNLDGSIGLTDLSAGAAANGRLTRTNESVSCAARDLPEKSAIAGRDAE